MLTREEIEYIICRKGGGMEAMFEVSRKSFDSGYHIGYLDGKNNRLEEVPGLSQYEGSLQSDKDCGC